MFLLWADQAKIYANQEVTTNDKNEHEREFRFFERRSIKQFCDFIMVSMFSIGVTDN